MARTLFDQSMARRSTSRRPAGTLAVSVLLHAGVVAILVVLQITTMPHGLQIASPLAAFVLPPPASAPAPLPPARAPRPAPPAPGPARPAIAATAPAVAPDAIASEPPGPAIAATPGLAAGVRMGAGDGGVPSGGGDAIANLGEPPPAPASPLRVGGKVRPPVRVGYVAPVYPRLAEAARVDGEVVLEATIDATGRVGDVRVVRSIPLLDRAAIDAVSQWRYTPTRLNGQPIAVILQVRVAFSLR